uniref:Uncharacterized protein n=1 Tax=Anguilla anguilla TaxID=7936 RepID=A0A0E9PMX6_ANGAN
MCCQKCASAHAQHATFNRFLHSAYVLFILMSNCTHCFSLAPPTTLVSVSI